MAFFAIGLWVGAGVASSLDYAPLVGLLKNIDETCRMHSDCKTCMSAGCNTCFLGTAGTLYFDPSSSPPAEVIDQFHPWENSFVCGALFTPCEQFIDYWVDENNERPVADFKAPTWNGCVSSTEYASVLDLLVGLNSECRSTASCSWCREKLCSHCSLGSAGAAYFNEDMPHSVMSKFNKWENETICGTSEEACDRFKNEWDAKGPAMMGDAYVAPSRDTCPGDLPPDSASTIYLWSSISAMIFAYYVQVAA